MLQFHKILSSFSLFAEGFAFLAGLYYFAKFKNSYLKWFIVYLGVIFFSELISKFVLDTTPHYRKYFYDYFIIPLEFLFMFWLYNKSSGEKPALYCLFGLLYVLSIVFNNYLIDGDLFVVYSLSYTLGNLFLLIAALLELKKQLGSEDILQFKNNPMFYINAGVMALYLPTLPFFAFYNFFVKYKTIWTIYFSAFLILLILMYILFGLAFKCGKQKSY